VATVAVPKKTSTCASPRAAPPASFSDFTKLTRLATSECDVSVNPRFVAAARTALRSNRSPFSTSSGCL
jgi:hypothetical protein